MDRKAEKVAKLGVFVALAMILSYIEVLIPFHFGIPGVKLGIANLVVVTGLYLLSSRETFVISFLRIVLTGLLFGNGVSLIYSLAGGMFSFCVMLLCKKRTGLSIVGISMLGGVFHNMGQILAAAVVLGNVRIAIYLPVLLVAGVLTGVMIGWIAQRLVDTLKK